MQQCTGRAALPLVGPDRRLSVTVLQTTYRRLRPIVGVFAILFGVFGLIGATNRWWDGAPFSMGASVLRGVALVLGFVLVEGFGEILGAFFGRVVPQRVKDWSRRHNYVVVALFIVGSVAMLLGITWMIER